MEARGGHGKPFVSNNSPFCFLGGTEARRGNRKAHYLETTEEAELTGSGGRGPLPRTPRPVRATASKPQATETLRPRGLALQCPPPPPCPRILPLTLFSPCLSVSVVDSLEFGIQ
jgi:hypothetical protein